jgi:hypothetical protein
MADVMASFYPRTATGRSSLIPSPPWYYPAICSRSNLTDPARVAGFFRPRSNWPGRIRVQWRSSGRLAILLVLPGGVARPGALAVQGGLVVVRCSFRGRRTPAACTSVAGRCHRSRPPSGYPKKLGSMCRPDRNRFQAPADR